MIENVTLQRTLSYLPGNYDFYPSIGIYTQRLSQK